MNAETFRAKYQNISTLLLLPTNEPINTRPRGIGTINKLRAAAKRGPEHSFTSNYLK